MGRGTLHLIADMSLVFTTFFYLLHNIDLKHPLSSAIKEGLKHHMYPKLIKGNGLGNDLQQSSTINLDFLYFYVFSFKAP